MPFQTADLFGTPDSTPPQPRIFSVSEVTKAVRGVIESAFDEVWVQGEVSNYRLQSSGHQYFTLKDAAAQLSCVLFSRGGAWRKTVPLQDGMLVQAKGRLTVYEARGQYQLNVSLVQAAGAGLLQAKFEALKRKLDAEGLFDPRRKRALPPFPRAVGVVTSPSGAALRDMLNVLARRAPWLRLIVSPARVQGDGAAAEIATAMDDLNRLSATGVVPVDLIVLSRGGGSIEDLWEFNDENLARAIAASRLPVVSAVGHEIDFTIADFVADLRAPTPSAAAELIAPDTEALLRLLESRRSFLHRRVVTALETARAHLTGLKRAGLFREAADRMQQSAQRLDLAERALLRTGGAQIAVFSQGLAEVNARLRERRPDQILAIYAQRLSGLGSRIVERFEESFRTRKNRFARGRDMLRLLSPEHTIGRGYTVTTTADGKLVRLTGDVVAGEKLETRLRDGRLTSIVAGHTPRAGKPRQKKSKD